ncbi:MAG: DmsE family decaheme c-type cytochrome [Burkholderiales bacterium]
MRFKSLIAMTGVLAAVAAFTALPVQAQPKPATPQLAPVCANCHDAQWKSIDLSPHGAKNDADGGMCQACHGNATDHLKDPMKAKPANPFGKGGTADARTAVCMTCHSGNRNLAFWTSGKHQLNEVTCSNCHSIHGKSLAPTINKFVTTFLPNQADICANCHQPIRAATLKPSHHPIPEGKVRCTDCHNPHGAITPAMLKQPTINDQCYSCHADKRGPYVFNHPPVEENCATCHNPHGSVHAKLLNESAPNLCQDCHDWSRHPGTIYGAAGSYNCQPGDNTVSGGVTVCPPSRTGQPNPSVNNRLVSRACLNCHSAVHGSNAPGNRGKFFTR